MNIKINLDSVFKPSEDVVARDIQGELIIVPITNGIGDSNEEMFTLNETGRAIWEKLDGRRTLKEIAASLVSEFAAPLDEIERDTLGLVQELLKRKMLDGA